AGLAQMMNNSPALANQLQLIAPDVIHEWWQQVREDHTYSQQHALWSSMPEVIGNLEGVPYTIRNRSNKPVLKRQIADIEAQLEDLAAARTAALHNAGLSPAVTKSQAE